MADAQIASMSRSEILQRGLEDASIMPDLATLNAARDLVLSQRIREAFGPDLAKIESDPSIREAIMRDPEFFNLVLRTAQRQVEYNALQSSQIFQPVQAFKPETLPTLGVMALGTVGGVVTAITMSHWLPIVGSFSVLGIKPLAFAGHPLLHEPLQLLAIWMSMRMMTRKTFVQKPKPYGSDGGGPDKKPKNPAAPPAIVTDQDEETEVPAAPKDAVDPTLAPRPPVTPK
jgi:hypothetical protein